MESDIPDSVEIPDSLSKDEFHLAAELVQAYQDEVASALGYLPSGLSLEGVFGEIIGEDLVMDFDNEIAHARQIADELDRTFNVIVPFGGDIDFERQLEWENLLSSNYTANEDEILSFIEYVIELEEGAIDRYTNIAELAEVAGYPDIRAMAEDFLGEERGHLDEMESYREQFLN